MMQVPDYEEFQSLVRRVEKIEQENREFRAQLVVPEWLSRQETMQLLAVSESTLWRLTKANVLVHRYQGKRPFYEIAGLKNYLTTQKINAKAIECRVDAVCQNTV